MTIIGGYDAYVATPKGDYPKEKVLLYLADVFIFGIPNNKLNADYFAMNGFRTIVPDFL